MRPFIITKPKIQRKAELVESDNRVAESKKKALAVKKRKSKTKSESEESYISDDYIGEEEVEKKPKKTKVSKSKVSKSKKAKKPKLDPDEWVAPDGEDAKPKQDEWGIAVYEKPETPLKKLSQIKGKKLRSILATNREEILQLVESDEIDTASAVIYKRMLQALVDVVGHTEAMIHKSKGARGTHQMNLLVGSIRDILLDLQQAQDRGMLAENLCTRFLAPSYLAIGMEILRENEMLFNRMKRELDRDSIDRYSKVFAEQEVRVGSFVQSQYVAMREEVKKFLQR